MELFSGTCELPMNDEVPDEGVYFFDYYINRSRKKVERKWNERKKILKSFRDVLCTWGKLGAICVERKYIE